MFDEREFIDEIYEAAVVPQLWPPLLEKLATKLDAALGSIYVTYADGSVRWSGTDAANRLFQEFISLKKPIAPVRFERAAQLLHDSFYTDDDFNDPNIFEHPVYQEFLYPRGYGWFTAATFNLPTGEAVNIGFERHRERGPFERKYIDELNRLRPHLGRAAVMSAQLELERASGMLQALSAVSIPSAVLRANGTLHVANEDFQKLMPDVVLDRRKRVSLSDAAPDRLLGEAIARLVAKEAKGQSRSIPVPAKESRPPLIFHLVPVRGAASDIFAQGLALLVATPVDRGAVPSAEVLQVLFDLTPAEARVTRGIAEGKTVEAIAIANGVSRETVRTQLASVLTKCGLNRQAELVALLAGKTIE